MYQAQKKINILIIFFNIICQSIRNYIKEYNYTNLIHTIKGVYEKISATEIIK